jgi:DegV family protein with EDD domain
MSVAVITDSNSGISQEEAKQYGIYVIPMPFYINEKLYLEDVTMSQKEFYEFLAQGVDVNTSQPAPAEVTDLWDKLLEEYDEIIHMPMSSGLSSTCETAMMLARDDAYEGKVFVVNNQRISITQRQAALEAKKLANAGLSAAKIFNILTRTKLDSGIYITVDTMTYLKKGGRVTPAAAGIATILNIKPVLQIQGGKLDQYAKSRGMKSAKKEMINAIKKDITGRFAEYYKNGRINIAMAYTGEKDAALEYLEELKPEFPDYDFNDFLINPLSLSVSCHIGPGALALACTRIVDVDDVN